MPINNPVALGNTGLGLKRVSRVEKLAVPPRDPVTVQWEMEIIALVYQVETSAPARVRLYNSEAARNADTDRRVNVEPLPGQGLLLEVVTTPNRLTLDLSPVVWTVAEDEVYYGLITHQESAAIDVEVSLHFIG
jgi:hypothetical protein